MTRQEKRKFIRNLTTAVRDDLLKKVGAMPEEWDGIELRRLLADKFEREVFSDLLKGRRLKNFRNEVAVRNL